MTEKDEYIIKIDSEIRDEILAGLKNNQADYFRIADQGTSIGKLAINTDARELILKAKKTMVF
jgi:hypothetical protein